MVDTAGESTSKPFSLVLLSSNSIHANRGIADGRSGVGLLARDLETRRVSDDDGGEDNTDIRM